MQGPPRVSEFLRVLSNLKDELLTLGPRPCACHTTDSFITACHRCKLMVCCPLLRCMKTISYKDHVTNEEVRANIQQAIGPHEDLLTFVKGRKLQWYGHVCRSSDLAKTILPTFMKRGRRQGRHRKRWEDNNREWTNLEFAKSQRTVENREKNKEKWLLNHLWCPNDPRG